MNEAEITEVVQETADIRSLRIRKVDGTSFGPIDGGAHVDIMGPTGIMRQYSVASDPADTSSILIAVKKTAQSRGGSSALHSVSIGDRINVGQPRNVLALSPKADKHVLIAGGIGITPLLSMAYELHGRGADFHLHYFSRSRDELAFAGLLENGVQFHDRVTIYIGKARSEHPPILKSLTAGLTESTHVYTCGPVGFMDQVSRIFEPVVGRENVHIERFKGDTSENRDNMPFTVELSTGQTFEIPADRSILSVLEEHDIPVFKSCGQGLCGSCLSGVVEGIPDHRDICLSDADKAANKEVAICVSRALSEKLVIELY